MIKQIMRIKIIVVYLIILLSAAVKTVILENVGCYVLKITPS